MSTKKPRKGQKKNVSKRPAKSPKKAASSAGPSRRTTTSKKKLGGKQKTTAAVKVGRTVKSVKKADSAKRTAPVKKVKVINNGKTLTRSQGKAATEKKQRLSPRERMLQEIRKKLIEQKVALLSEAEEALNVLPGQTIFPDLGDQASAEIDRNFMLRLRGREQRLLKKIEEAIEKIESGSFGICDVCGEEIDMKRLEARPVTTMCISCKTEQEEEEKTRGY